MRKFAHTHILLIGSFSLLHSSTDSRPDNSCKKSLQYLGEVSLQFSQGSYAEPELKQAYSVYLSSRLCRYLCHMSLVTIEADDVSAFIYLFAYLKLHACVCLHPDSPHPLTHTHARTHAYTRAHTHTHTHTPSSLSPIC